MHTYLYIHMREYSSKRVLSPAKTGLHFLPFYKRQSAILGEEGHKNRKRDETECILSCMHAFVCTYACVYTDMYVCIYVCLYPRVLVCMHDYTYVCIYECWYRCVYEHMHTHTHTHAQTQTQTHTFAFEPPLIHSLLRSTHVRMSVPIHVKKSCTHAHAHTHTPLPLGFVLSITSLRSIHIRMIISIYLWTHTHTHTHTHTPVPLVFLLSLSLLRSIHICMFMFTSV